MLVHALVAAALVAGPVASPAAAPDGTELIDGARAYVAALVDHDPSDVPFHPQATRVEAGLKTGFSGEQLRNDLKYGLQYRVITGVRDERYTVDGNVVTADFVLDVGILGLPLAKSRIHETFAFEDGKIKTIVADISLV